MAIIHNTYRHSSIRSKKTIAFCTLAACLSSCKSMAPYDAEQRFTAKPSTTKSTTATTTLALREQELADVMASSQPLSKREKLSSPRSQNHIQKRLMAQYSEWKGTPYRFGGSSKRGIDCSAFLQKAFKAGFGFSLPRSTEEQVKVGKKISKKHLKPGDLVFFKTGRSRRHVGVYIGNSRFMHASSSQGVTITSLNDKYWRSRYWKSRRVM